MWVFSEVFDYSKGYTNPLTHLSATERAGPSNVVGGSRNLSAVDYHAEVVDGSAVVVGLPLPESGNAVHSLSVAHREESIFVEYSP